VAVFFAEKPTAVLPAKPHQISILVYIVLAPHPDYDKKAILSDSLFALNIPSINLAAINALSGALTILKT
jgi:hypothetical protein